MKFSSETLAPTSDSVVERTFALDAASGDGPVPGVLWTPADAAIAGTSTSAPAPLVLMGHGGGLHKKADGLVARAVHMVETYGFRVASLDAPGHGDRTRSPEDERWVATMFRARADGDSIAPIVAEFNASLVERAVPEWQAALDALQTLPEIGAHGPVGFGGLTLASAIGIALASVDPRITAAVFGGVLVYPALTEAAKRVTIPLHFILPWGDAEIDRASGLALFDAFGSADKSLHTTQGGHHEVPWYEVEETERFYARQFAAQQSAAQQPAF